VAFGHPQMDPKGHSKADKWVGCMAQSISLAPNQIMWPIVRGEMVQNNQMIVFFMLSWVFELP
jgi:hypothetical protein